MGAVGAAAVSGCAPAAARSVATRRDLDPSGSPIALQPGAGPTMGTYLPSRLDTVLWGELPTRRTRPVLSVRLSQAVDRTVGVHGLISKADFRRS